MLYPHPGLAFANKYLRQLEEGVKALYGGSKLTQETVSLRNAVQTVRAWCSTSACHACMVLLCRSAAGLSCHLGREDLVSSASG
jgi:hypothetical protein